MNLKGMLGALALAMVIVMAAQADETKPRLAGDAAQKLALAAVPGTVQNIEPLTEKNYTFDIETEKKEFREVVVDGDTGKILSNKAETADDVAKKRKKHPIKHRVEQY